VNAELRVKVPPEVVTTRSRAPTVPAGATAVMVVGLTTIILEQGAPPIVTDGNPEKLVPVIVTSVPPAAEPVEGLTPVTVGGETEDRGGPPPPPNIAE